MPTNTIQQAFELAVQHHYADRLTEAEAIYRQILAFDPAHAESLHLLGVIAHQMGKHDVAVELIGRALVQKPNWPDALANQGSAMNALGRMEEAVAVLSHAVALAPGHSEAHNNLGNALRDLGRPDDAIAAYRQAITIRPDYAEAHANLGNVLKDKGRVDEAIACYRRAIALKPAMHKAHSYLVYTIQFHPGFDPRSVYEEHVAWNRQHAEPLRPLIKPHTNDRNPGRRLRIGYVSPDFRRHPVGRYMLPLLRHHDHQQFEIFCYASVRRPDDLTNRLAQCADVWRDVSRTGDAQLADMIRRDQVDILVDLSLHMSDNRLLVFARKPAPVQVTWLGYPGTTGLKTIDYRITDEYMDPPGENEAFYSEVSIRLPQASCFEPVEPTPAVNPLPAISSSRVTFGCLNDFCKISASVMNAWIRVLQSVPESRLLLSAPEGEHRQRARDRLAHYGLDPQRVRFVGFAGGGTRYFEFFHQIDICLDPFPYGGGTTTCESLWMGVPVITLAGTTASSRMGLGILSCIGLPELVTRTVEAYVQTAVDLADDLPRLEALRVGLRQRMETSPLMDAPHFARNLESAFRRMWKN